VSQWGIFATPSGPLAIFAPENRLGIFSRLRGSARWFGRSLALNVSVRELASQRKCE